MHHVARTVGLHPDDCISWQQMCMVIQNPITGKDSLVAPGNASGVGGLLDRVTKY